MLYKDVCVTAPYSIKVDQCFILKIVFKENVQPIRRKA